MQLTKERKVYGAILGLALAGLGAERVFLGGGPQSATAAPAELSAGINLSPPSHAEASQDLPESLARRLESRRELLPAPESPDNAFAIPASWLPEPEPSDEPETVPKFDTQGFASRNSLRRVMTGEGFRVAIMSDGSLVRPGQVVDGMTLVGVGTESAIFEAEGCTVELLLPGATGTGGATGAASENRGVYSPAR
jgi:hypothetical protein